MSGVNDMLAEARKSLGLGESPPGSNHNYITVWYGFDAAWCDMAVNYWAYHSGNSKAVCPDGKQAYTVAHAGDFQSIGRWYSGTTDNVNKAKPGDIVFFDWGGSNSIGAIDHVGVVEKNLGGGTLQTIEGNTSDGCYRRVRDASVIAGYGRPAYGPAAKPAYTGTYNGHKIQLSNGNPVLKSGSGGDEVSWLQSACVFIAGSKISVDGDFGPATTAAVKALQKKISSKVDGQYGATTYKDLVAYIKRHAPAPSPTPKPTPTPKPKVTVPSGNPVLKVGSTGTAVKQLQTALNTLFKAGLEVDGDFGAKTKAALVSAQKALKVTADGEYGPNTAKALAAKAK